MTIYGIVSIIVVVFVVACWVGWLLSNCLKNKKPESLSEEINEEVKLLSVTILEVKAENKVLDDGLTQRVESLEKLNMREFSPNFFKPTCKDKFSNLKELNDNYKIGLNDYPEFSPDEAKQVSYIINFHKKYLEHHAYVGDLAAEYFKAMDELLREFSDSTQESTQFTV